MKTCTLILPLVFAAISCTAARIVHDEHDVPSGPNPTSNSYGLSWKQTHEKATNQTQGGLGSSVSGYFPEMSKEKIGLGCGINWGNGSLHAGFDGGDPDNGVGGGFDWKPHALSSIVGVHFKGTKINLNMTITEQNTVLFNVNGFDLDWDKVLQQQLHKDAEKDGEGYGGEFPAVTDFKHTGPALLDDENLP
ncbi:hypothetical protein EX895_003768 [Sporisorium graminicola]|uniref:Uncharacterized protein n=1 Tax=Sporisorium graminicola TaxID=280036 RepID=A0A4U7KRM2_9BASI|nr:hypothetical protein EX895_003768 [Sporisorium graminicola]TKY87091.1 hypothetical protein EX895_003768 [Sporisorium graminicola]